jgi:hypothetical protein
MVETHEALLSEAEHLSALSMVQVKVLLYALLLGLALLGRSIFSS